eukprot:SAG31_NODE_27680_length_422_cov_0.640867_2_plen_41_part_01
MKAGAQRSSAVPFNDAVAMPSVVLPEVITFGTAHSINWGEI